jgi:hypothetical protein
MTERERNGRSSLAFLVSSPAWPLDKSSTLSRACKFTPLASTDCMDPNSWSGTNDH